MQRKKIELRDWETETSRNTTPLVSVCCLTYNHAPYIRQCLDGFMIQKADFLIEVLIHDDASTDGTADIIREYEAKYPDSIKPIYQVENQYSKKIRSISGRFNFPRAQGKYIALCEGDDYWTDPYKLQRQVDFLETHEEVALSAENGWVKNSVINKEHLFNEEKNERLYSAYEMLQTRRFPTASVVFPAKYLEDILKLKFTADTILWVLLSTKGRVHYNPVVSSVYNRGMHGLVQSTDRIKWAKMGRNWDNQMIEIIKNSSLKDDFDYNIFRERRYNEFWDAYISYQWSKCPVKKFLCMLECLKVKPKKILGILFKKIR